MAGEDRVTHAVAAWSHLAEHGDIELTGAAFPDLVSSLGHLDRDVMELYVAELNARADAAAEHAREVAAATSRARLEHAVSVILRTCERLRDEHGLNASELEAAAVVVAVLAALEVEL